MAVNCPYCHAEIETTEEAARSCPHCGKTLTIGSHLPTLDAATVGAPLPPEQPVDGRDPLIGTELSHYLVERFLGAGGMGRVYLARHLTLYRSCALKVLAPELCRSQPQLLELLLSEARAAAQLVHPHIVAIHYIGFDRDYHFIEMEYIEGQSLKALVERGPLDLARATRFVEHVAQALGEAHRRNVIHRDIKPSNVLVTSQDIAKLADFGLARNADDLRRQKSSSLSGTPNFMAPELWRGEAATRQSDIYALGVTYFYLCTGRYPFAASRLARLARLHLEEYPPDVRTLNPHVPESIAGLIDRCLAKNPADRPQDVEELRHALHAIYLQLRSLEALVREALIGQPAVLNVLDKERFEIRLDVGGGRGQTVFVEQCERSWECEPVVRVYSPCGPARPDYYRRALELNARSCFGALAITDCGGAPQFVMLDAHPRSSCDPVALRSSILSVAQHADDVERALTGKDVL
ncbi:MAG: hypothetical protein KatS3mg110_4656 [Pirellulaceae bacterium]|nr:MAG: hypothetical protein KatS3mg110_4656 [Pirellulaceae bacterium]